MIGSAELVGRKRVVAAGRKTGFGKYCYAFCMQVSGILNPLPKRLEKRGDGTVRVSSGRPKATCCGARDGLLVQAASVDEIYT